jgi:hypothetical protein
MGQLPGLHGIPRPNASTQSATFQHRSWAIRRLELRSIRASINRCSTQNSGFAGLMVQGVGSPGNSAVFQFWGTSFTVPPGTGLPRRSYRSSSSRPCRSLARCCSWERVLDCCCRAANGCDQSCRSKRRKAIAKADAEARFSGGRRALSARIASQETKSVFSERQSTC